MLDVGTGAGFLACDLAEQLGAAGRVVAIDRSEAMLALARRRIATRPVTGRVKLHQADAAALPYPDGSFDAVTATSVFQYVPDVLRAVAEAYRVLRPGGSLVNVDHDWATPLWHAESPFTPTAIASAPRTSYGSPPEQTR